MDKLNSSLKESHQILAVLAPAKAEQALIALANVPGDLSEIESPKVLRITEPAIRRLESHCGSIFEDCPPIPLLTLRDLLRKAWVVADRIPRAADWYVYRFRHLAWATAQRVRHVRKAQGAPEREIPGGIPTTFNEAMQLIAASEPPPVTELEAAAFYFHKNLNRALFCGNEECPAPYFFGTKKGQKFCSAVCALPAQRQAKRKWWNENRAKKGRKR